MLPARFRDVAHLEDVMTTPSAALVDTLRSVPGDILVLGVGGKMGPTLARLAKRAAPGKRVIGVARFSEPGLRESLQRHGIECIAADLLSREQLAALPDAPNVVFMAGRKFGSSGSEWLTFCPQVRPVSAEAGRPGRDLSTRPVEEAVDGVWTHSVDHRHGTRWITGAAIGGSPAPIGPQAPSSNGFGPP